MALPDVSIASTRVRDKRFTVDDYHRMADTGILDHRERLELINGRIIEMFPIGPAHSFLVSKLTGLIYDRIDGDPIVSVQSPVRLDDRNEPEPDIAILAGPHDRYRRRHPAAGDVLLLIEVADSSLEYDRNEKLALYAEHAIAEVWIVNVIDKRVEQYRSPDSGEYQAVASFADGQKIEAASVENLVIEIADLRLESD